MSLGSESTEDANLKRITGMTGVSTKHRGASTLMNIFSTKRLQVLLLITLLAHLTCDAEGVANCCTRKPGACRLFDLLCRDGYKNSTDMAKQIGLLTNDASAGILTLGKRREGERRFQNRLQQLLHGSRNPAAGILTMGKRLERPLKYLINPNKMPDRGSYRRR
ncbi:hypocretin neuropeptide precursor [Chanos chanos]|uniref:Hypocretin neuropeptide precursor n=1 Tax=Chanos chanos TaxID=29144 RepID=A0A6J2X0A4_CHACN|nr:orexin [Chanos chanos]